MVDMESNRVFYASRTALSIFNGVDLDTLERYSTSSFPKEFEDTEVSEVGKRMIVSSGQDRDEASQASF